MIPVSRICYYFATGHWPEGVVRFIDGDSTNFRARNLSVLRSQLNSPATALQRKEKMAKQEAERYLRFEEEQSLVDAYSGLEFFDNVHTRNSHIKTETANLRSAIAGGFPNPNDPKTDDEFHAAAALAVDNRNAPRDAVDRYLKRQGMEPPEDRQEAFRLRLALS